MWSGQLCLLWRLSEIGLLLGEPIFYVPRALLFSNSIDRWKGEIFLEDGSFFLVRTFTHRTPSQVRKMNAFNSVQFASTQNQRDLLERVSAADKTKISHTFLIKICKRLFCISCLNYPPVPAWFLVKETTCSFQHFYGVRKSHVFQGITQRSFWAYACLGQRFSSYSGGLLLGETIFYVPRAIVFKFYWQVKGWDIFARR